MAIMKGGYCASADNSMFRAIKLIMLSSFIRVAACTCWVCCQMTLLKIIIKITHFKTKPAVGYLFSSFSFIIIRGNGGIRIDKYRLSSLIEVLCFTFSGIEFHNMVVDGIKDFW